MCPDCLKKVERIWNRWWFAWFFAVMAAAMAHSGRRVGEFLFLAISTGIAVANKFRVDRDCLKKEEGE